MCLEQRSPIKHGAMVPGQMYMGTKGNILLNEYRYNVDILAEGESFTSSVFTVLHGHNIILYCEPVP